MKQFNPWANDRLGALTFFGADRLVRPRWAHELLAVAASAMVAATLFYGLPLLFSSTTPTAIWVAISSAPGLYLLSISVWARMCSKLPTKTSAETARTASVATLSLLFFAVISFVTPIVILELWGVQIRSMVGSLWFMFPVAAMTPYFFVASRRAFLKQISEKST
jgi:hypothetical protein